MSVCYAGEESPACLPAEGEEGFVLQLQYDLHRLGFRFSFLAWGAFGRLTEWAVRELQIYAKMPFLAKDPSPPADLSAPDPKYAERLVQVENPAPYTGPITGVVNPETRQIISLWKHEHLRCPVVIGAWLHEPGDYRAARKENGNVASNLWEHDAHDTTAPRMFARDLSGYYPCPADYDPTQLQPIGYFQPGSSYSGPGTEVGKHTHPIGKVTPERLVPSWDGNPAQLSTYRVVRTFSQQEFTGYFDCLNGYDNCFASVGPCHWTIGLCTKIPGVYQLDPGEMGGFIAYLEAEKPEAYQKAFGNFGLSTDKSWRNGVFSAGSRKYYATAVLSSAEGTPSPLGKKGANGVIGRNLGTKAKLRPVEREWDYFRTWHWHYRFAMAGRTLTEYRHAMWDMARMRIRDVGEVSGLVHAGKSYKIKEIFNSELTMCMLIRWHIFRPKHVCKGASKPGSDLMKAFKAAIKNKPAQLLADWPSAKKEQLQTDLRDNLLRFWDKALARKKRKSTGLKQVRDYKVNGQKLSLEHGSFKFDMTGLNAEAGT